MVLEIHDIGKGAGIGCEQLVDLDFADVDFGRKPACGERQVHSKGAKWDFIGSNNKDAASRYHGAESMRKP